MLSFMASVDSSVMDFWEEYDARFPLNDNHETWIRHAAQMMQLETIANHQLAAAGVPTNPVTMNAFLPQRYQIEIKPQSAERQEEALRKGLRL